jgi:polyisoprenoid-binding protein YceI
MLHRTLVPALALAFAAPAFAQNVNTDPKNAPTGTYEVEPTHTSVCFTIGHMGLSAYPGCFEKISGGIGFDGKDPKNSKADITIDLSSVYTASAKLNEKLKKDFFKTDVNKTATFRSTSAKVTGPNKGTITGELMLNGVTKPVTLNVTFNGGLKHPFAGRYALGFDATTTIKRSDFGLDKVDWSAFVSDEVKLVIAAELIAKE